MAITRLILTRPAFLAVGSRCYGANARDLASHTCYAHWLPRRRLVLANWTLRATRAVRRRGKTTCSACVAHTIRRSARFQRDVRACRAHSVRLTSSLPHLILKRPLRTRGARRRVVHSRDLAHCAVRAHAVRARRGVGRQIRALAAPLHAQTQSLPRRRLELTALTRFAREAGARFLDLTWRARLTVRSSVLAHIASAEAARLARVAEERLLGGLELPSWTRRTAISIFCF